MRRMSNLTAIALAIGTHNAIEEANKAPKEVREQGHVLGTIFLVIFCIAFPIIGVPVAIGALISWLNKKF